MLIKNLNRKFSAENIKNNCRLNKSFETKSNNIKGKALILYKKKLHLTKIQREIIIGTLLGNATMPKQKKGNNYNIKFEQKLENNEYIYNLYENFKS